MFRRAAHTGARTGSGFAAAGLARAALCYALALVVGVSLVFSPLIAGVLAAPGEADAAATAAAAETASGSSGSSAGGGTSSSSSAEQPTSYTLHKLTKITVAAYPLADGSDGWQVRTSKGRSAATKTISERGGMLRLAVSAVWDDGVTTREYNTSDENGWSSRPGFTEGFTYESSDAQTISVNSIGVVTALKDGEATITVTPKNADYKGKTAEITIRALNQAGGLRVEKIQIVDENDKPYGDDPVKFTKLFQTEKLYAKVTYENEDAKGSGKSAGQASGLRQKVVYSNAPNAASDEKPNSYERSHYYKSVSEAFANIVWRVGDTQYVTLTSHDGVATLKAIANSLTRVYATITGGDASKDVGFGAGVLYSSVAVNVADKERARADGEVPSDDLNIKVVYEKTPDKTVKQVHYTLAQFKKLGAITRTYTLTRSGGRYVTDRATGVPVQTILVKLGIDTDDISYFTLAANDGANPGRLSAQFLLKTTRYYLPNYDLGGSWQEKEQVPTMIAYEDSWNSDTTVTGEMNSGTRFRLVFGSATSADQSTDKSIKFINTITIVMKGAAPSTKGKGEHNTDNGDNGNGSGANGAGNGGGSQGGGSGSGSGSGSGQTGQGSSNGTSGTVGPKAVTNATKASDSDAGAKASSSVGAKSDSNESAPWRVFEMMNKSASDLAQRYEDNPFLPYLAPAVGILLLLAATARFLRFRRQLR